MSVNTVERVLWELTDDKERVQAFLSDPDGYLARYPLSEQEFKMVRTMDVAAFDEYGVSNMLGMMSWSAVMGNNPVLMFDYLTRINHGTLPNHMQLPGWQFNLLRFVVSVRNAVVGALNFFGLKKSLN